MDIETRLENALASPQPRAQLQKAVVDLLEQGFERDEILPALEAFRSRLAEQQRANDVEHLLDLIDGLTGWCNLP